ncbi:DsbA family protein [Celeribacter litoreus]|uniref:DsbA family protein n=1 Tax=Celeribacter litoreus TaxID=2876714 RepID=UPI001CCD3935|nr:DsbA family protein [Celeribacter litoreus]MCA0044143.1 DsbA family protein [Celeribacter litoreus]
MTETTNAPRFTYLYDTYCGWCYAGAPVITALIEAGGEVEMRHRLLFAADQAQRMGDGLGRMIEQYDARAEALSGQPFSDAYRENVLRAPDELLDSTLTAQAAALVHGKGAKSEMALARRLQKARWEDGRSAQDAAHMESILREEFGVDAPLSTAEEPARDMARSTEQMMRQYGLSGVPVLIMEKDGTLYNVALSDYYKQPERIAALLE